MTLVELGQQGYRGNGGIGFTIEAPTRCLEFVESSTFDISALSSLDFTCAEIEQLCTSLSNVSDQHNLLYATTLIFAGG